MNVRGLKLVTWMPLSRLSLLSTVIRYTSALERRLWWPQSLTAMGIEKPTPRPCLVQILKLLSDQLHRRKPWNQDLEVRIQEFILSSRSVASLL